MCVCVCVITLDQSRMKVPQSERMPGHASSPVVGGLPSRHNLATIASLALASFAHALPAGVGWAGYRFAGTLAVRRLGNGSDGAMVALSARYPHNTAQNLSTQML